MLFNSYEFLFLFLPIAWMGYFFLHSRLAHSAATWWLLLVSLAFYAYWNPIYLPLLLGSIIVNYGLGYTLSTIQSTAIRRVLLVCGIAVNLALLGYFKYADFFLSNIYQVTGSSYDLLHIILPLGISFFTFQQIAYLVDIYRHKVQHGMFKTYALFVTFFPHLIAGPIVHHAEMMPQFADSTLWKPQYRNIALGFFLLTVGLFKKVIFADSLAPFADAGFDSTYSLSFFEAWVTSVAYSFQLYFDFSAYSDMAIGIALFFNILLPLNFNSPYKAHSLRDFWQRWHMTLTRFLREYVYFPLGGNRAGEWMTIRNTLIVFLLAGLWHGAGWTFVVWGALNGIGLVVGALWARTGIVMGRIWAQVLTLLFLNVAWVFFRAPSLERAFDVLEGMLGLNGFVLPASLSTVVTLPGVTFAKLFVESSAPSIGWAVVLIGVSFFVCLFSENTWEITKRFKPNWKWFSVLAVMFCIVLYFMDDVSAFIYFNF